MAHTFFCEKCGKRFDVDPALVGRRAKCKQCQNGFLIPGPDPGAGAGAGAGRPASPRADLPVDDPYGLVEASPLPPRSIPEAVLDDDDMLPPRPGKPAAAVRPRSSKRPG